jgi:hypothetical protein
MVRLLTLLALLVTLPGYGLAGIVNVRTCQEQMNPANHVSLASDCCPGKTHTGAPPCKRAGDGSQQGQKDSCGACKAGFNCKSPQSYEPSPSVTLFMLRAPSAVLTDPPALLLFHSPGGLWRPPRQI